MIHDVDRPFVIHNETALRRRKEFDSLFILLDFTLKVNRKTEKKKTFLIMNVIVLEGAK
jgi:hypothetical protein